MVVLVQYTAVYLRLIMQTLAFVTATILFTKYAFLFHTEDTAIA